MPVLSTPDTELHYELAGQGEPLLLIQGVGCIGKTWEPQVRDLQSDHEILTFDNRGIGQSLPCRAALTIEAMARDALALMDHVGWTSAHVAGHSMGGLIAQQLALDAPTRVRSLSLQCTFSRGAEAARLTLWVIWMNLRIRLGPRRSRRRAFLEMILPPGSVTDDNTDALIAKLTPLIGRDLSHQPSILMKQLMAMKRHDVSSRLRELAGISTMVISAAHDPIAKPEYGRRLASLIPGAIFTEIDNASHAVTIHAASAVNGIMRAFIHNPAARP